MADDNARPVTYGWIFLFWHSFWRQCSYLRFSPSFQFHFFIITWYGRLSILFILKLNPNLVTFLLLSSISIQLMLEFMLRILYSSLCFAGYLRSGLGLSMACFIFLLV